MTILFVSNTTNRQGNIFSPFSMQMPFLPTWGMSIRNMVPKNKETFFVSALKYDHEDQSITVVLSDTLKKY